jgi:ubiquinone/menaquinone biosynthesis C-methylase UbiE
MTTTRSRLVWDWVGANITWIERVGRPYLHLPVHGLGLTGGETVLDVGCGTGVHFPAVRPAVGPHGRIVGVDFSPRSLAKARRRVERHGWDNIELVRADATTTPLGDTEFDAALAMTSLSAMPDIPAAVDHVYAALRPGGRLFVADVRPKGLLRLGYRLIAGAPGEDVTVPIRERFDSVTLLDKNAEATTRPAASTTQYLMLVATKRR